MIPLVAVPYTLYTLVAEVKISHKHFVFNTCKPLQRGLKTILYIIIDMLSELLMVRLWRCCTPILAEENVGFMELLFDMTVV